MSLQLRSVSAVLPRASFSNSPVSVYSTVANNALPDFVKAEFLFERCKDVKDELPKSSDEVNAELFKPGVIPPANTRMGIVFHQGKNIARQLCWQIKKDRKPLLQSESTLHPMHLARRQSKVLLWQDTFVGDGNNKKHSHELTLDPAPVVVCENPKMVAKTLSEIDSFSLPLSVSGDDIILYTTSTVGESEQHFVASSDSPSQRSLLDTCSRLHQINDCLPQLTDSTRGGHSKTHENSLEEMLNPGSVRSIFEMRHSMYDLDPPGTFHQGIQPSSYSPNMTVLYSNQSSLDTSQMKSESNDLESSKQPNGDPGNRPSAEQLAKIHDRLAENLPQLFVRTLDYSIFRQDVILENNFFETPKVTVGLTPYAMAMMKLRWWAHWRYSNVTLNILKITHHKNEGTVKVRWRVSGLPQWESTKIWKFLPWKYRKNLNQEAEWHDAFSVFSVGSDGLIFKHKIDRIMPDEEQELAKANRLVEKMAKLVGVAPK